MDNKRSSKKALGISAEKITEVFLTDKGYEVLAKNFKTKFGEIDLIARKGDHLVFVEVKSTSKETPYNPEEKVNLHKKRRILWSAKIFCLKNSQILSRIKSISFDVVVVNLKDGEIKHYESAFFIEGDFSIY